ncbi:response regulator [Amaricoccus sp.]|uniref:response regulator n=1 Tax=Amaricoccus sp. TaxID=1872485 RepID=UPI001B58D157|nr:response regulator [Amaricoccus sp.]MBP7002759.1 response regulator [Amaricoccus sp.]
MRLLLIEDDITLGGALADYLRGQGHAVDWAQGLADADAAAETVRYDQILLDLNLPDGRGLAFLARLRTSRDATPVIILTARDQISDRLAGLNSGADDYMVKPFDLSELSARIAAVARRYGGLAGPEIVLDALSINLALREVRQGGKAVDLTGREWAVLARLAARPGVIVPKAEIEDALYSFGAEIESNAVEVFVSRLRRKIGAGAITTHRGLGYRLERP